MGIQSVNILKFDSGKVLLYPLRTIKDCGSFAIPPYMVKFNISYEEMAMCIDEVIKFSGSGLNPPHGSDRFFDKKTMEITGIKNSKMMHDNSLQVGIYTKNGQYHISSTENRGYRKGFNYKKENISISLSCSTKELAMALSDAFNRCD